jgi:hypothetical protein
MIISSVGISIFNPLCSKFLVPQHFLFVELTRTRHLIYEYHLVELRSDNNQRNQYELRVPSLVQLILDYSSGFHNAISSSTINMTHFDLFYPSNKWDFGRVFVDLILVLILRLILSSSFFFKKIKILNYTSTVGCFLKLQERQPGATVQTRIRFSAGAVMWELWWIYSWC